MNQSPQEQLSEFVDLVYILASDSKGALGLMLAYTQLLLDEPEDFGSLTAKQQEFVKNISHNTVKSLEFWDRALEYIQVNHHSKELNLAQVPLKDVLDQAISIISKYFAPDKLKINTPEFLPSVIGNHLLPKAFSYLLLPELEKTAQTIDKFALFISAQEREPTLIEVIIRTNIDLETHHYPRANETFDLGSNLHLAERIIRQHDGELQVEYLSEGVEFRVTLPVSTEAPI